MDTNKLHPMDADNLKIFRSRLDRSSDAEVQEAWQRWQGQYSKNQVWNIKARLAKINRPESEHYDYEDRLDR